MKVVRESLRFCKECVVGREVVVLRGLVGRRELERVRVEMGGGGVCWGVPL